MKRIILLASLLLAATGCGTATNTNNANAPATPANSNSNMGASATPKAETNGVAASPVVAQEKQIWEMIKTKNPDGFGGLLAEDFTYVSNDGIYDKAATVNGIKDLDVTDLSFSDWKVVTLDEDAAVVIYTVDMKGTNNGQPIPPGAMRAGSVWVNRGGKWVGVFHQDTPVEEPPPDNAAGSKTEAKATPAADAKPAEPVSEDPVAREKQVWDAIKKKDYDRFASFLAEDQIEVFPWGVNDKAQSVEGVQKVDLSKAMLGDFKTVKLDDDATVVTYVVKGLEDMSPAGERSTTVWVKRDGKWLAAYHQSTSIKPATKSK